VKRRCSINAIVNLGVRLGLVKNKGCHLILFSYHRLSHHVKTKDPQSGEVISSINDYVHLGRQALFRGCFIDMIHCGYDSSQYRELDGLCGATGGILITGISLDDDALFKSFQKLLFHHHRKRSEVMSNSMTTEVAMDSFIFPYMGTVATCEIRTSPALRVDRVVGSLFTVEEASRYSR
jgi:hypothetical protein